MNIVPNRSAVIVKNDYECRKIICQKWWKYFTNMAKFSTVPPWKSWRKINYSNSWSSIFFFIPQRNHLQKRYFAFHKFFWLGLYSVFPSYFFSRLTVALKYRLWNKIDFKSNVRYRTWNFCVRRGWTSFRLWRLFLFHICSDWNKLSIICD